MMDSWIEQKGFPLVTVEMSENKIKINQESYLKSKAGVIIKRDNNPLE